MADVVDQNKIAAPQKLAVVDRKEFRAKHSAAFK